MNSSSNTYQKKEATWIIVALCLILQLFPVPAISTAANNDAYTERSDSTNDTSPLSWEQPLADELPGPGAFLDSVLGRLSRQSDDSEDQLKQLWSGVPKVLPDLFKVFISL